MTLRRSLRPLLAACALGACSQGLRAELTEVPLDISAGAGTRDGDFMQMQLEAEPRWDFDAGPGGSAVLSLRLRLDASDELEPGAPPFSSYARLTEPVTLGDAGTLELRDAYFERRLNSGLLRLGKQQVVWGRLDGVKVLDVVNPQSFREFILDDLADSRIGLWSAYADASLGDWRAELVWVPDLSSHDIPEAGAWFELAAPRFRFGAASGSPGLPVVTDRDGDPLRDSALGLRVSRLIAGVDVSALAYTGRDHEPLGRLVQGNGGPAVERYHRRRSVYGLSAESSFGAIAWRAELSHQPQRQFNRRAPGGLESVALDQTTFGAGADVQLPGDVLANVQFVWDRVADAPQGLVRPGSDRLMTVFLRRNFAYDSLQTELRWYHSLTDRDDTVAVNLRYAVSDETTFYLGAQWFSGVAEGLFGQFAPQDRLVIGVERYF